MNTDLPQDSWVERFAALEPTLTPMEAQRVRSAPERYKKLLKKAILGEASPRGAIKAFCQSCMGYEDLPRSVKECTARACPSWMYRPYQKREET